MLTIFLQVRTVIYMEDIAVKVKMFQMDYVYDSAFQKLSENRKSKLPLVLYISVTVARIRINQIQ